MSRDTSRSETKIFYLGAARDRFHDSIRAGQPAGSQPHPTRGAFREFGPLELFPMRDIRLIKYLRILKKIYCDGAFSAFVLPSAYIGYWPI
jgi:hypothetical protein